MNLTRVAVFISKYLKFGELYCPRRKNSPNFRYFVGKTETLIIINLRHVCVITIWNPWLEFIIYSDIIFQYFIQIAMKFPAQFLLTVNKRANVNIQPRKFIAIAQSAGSKFYYFRLYGEFMAQQIIFNNVSEIFLICVELNILFCAIVKA